MRKEGGRKMFYRLGENEYRLFLSSGINNK